MFAISAAHSSQSWGLWAAVAAVIIDSIVTCVVGWRLNRTAKREAIKAAETVKPALDKALGQAVVTLLPIVVETIKQHLSKEEGEDETVRPIRSIDKQ